jgi:hypothetical protein
LGLGLLLAEVVAHPLITTASVAADTRAIDPRELLHLMLLLPVWNDDARLPSSIPGLGRLSLYDRGGLLIARLGRRVAMCVERGGVEHA